MIMKYAIITDIHGNSSALKAVLDDIANKNIDHIICLGDMVGIGPDSNEVLEIITSRKNIFLNPGSLGCNHKPYARYGIIEVSGDYINEELLEVPYDNTKFNNAINLRAAAPTLVAKSLMYSLSPG